ncbi:MAG: hypothetical protein AB8F74_13320 [Saprospiraceae bacterium]
MQYKISEHALSIFNADLQRYYDEPMILLDNIPVFDIPELLKIDPSKIEAIEIYNTDYFLGDYTISGIISIISKTDNFANYKWGKKSVFTKFKTFKPTSSFEQSMQGKEGHTPDFRPIPYWNPSLSLTQQKSSDTISVLTPDQPGIYEIVIQGFTDTGKPCFGHVTFEVIDEL